MTTGQAPTNDPPSRVLARHLRAQIDSGSLAPGDRLPSERALAKTVGVARNTAREAIRILSEQGLVTAHHGRGVFVRHHTPLMRFGERRYARTLRQVTGLSPFRAEVESQGRTPTVDCRSVTHVSPPAEVAERLGLDPETDTVVRRENWYYADDEPVQRGITWSPSAIVEGTPISDSANLGPGSLYARFEEAGHAITSIREEVSARVPTPEEVEGLSIPDGVPVLRVLHTGFDQNGQAFEVTDFVMRSDQNALDYRMPVEEN